MTSQLRTISHYEINPLHRYLYKTIGSNATNHQFERYCVGTSNKWNGSTVFWQIDVNNNIRGGKVMAYNPQNGHRIKEPQAYVSWVHSLLKLSNYNLFLAAGGRGGICTGGGDSTSELTNWDGTKKNTGWGR